MKKALSIVLILATLLAIVSCKKTSNDQPTTPADTNSNIVTTPSETTKAETPDVTTPDVTTTDEISNTTTPDVTTPDEPSCTTTPEETTTEETPGVDVPNEKTDFLACLDMLLKGYKWNPASIIPEEFSPENASNFVDIDSINNSYANFVSVSNIPQNGIGEQWNMVIENISESQIFFTVLSVVDNLATVSVTAFNNYLDKNPSDIAHYQFEEGIYSVTIHCTEDTIDYVLEYTATIPVLGEQSVQIALSMDITTQDKAVRVQIGDANALRYTVGESQYSFAVKYFGARRAYFEILQNEDETLEGHIYEYWTAEELEIGVEKASVADFYITDEYVTVVGNKADGMIGFSGSICELYSATTGRMIAYEVKEEMEVLGGSITYNTLWFDLEDIDGIKSIKCIPGESLEDKDTFYVNGSKTAWAYETYGWSGGLKGASRRFDIEFRTQYFYYYDSVNQKYEKVKIEVPMLFVQEEVFDDLTKDVKKANGITVSVKIDDSNLEALMEEYASKTEILEENKEKYTVEAILAFIGGKKEFLN